MQRFTSTSTSLLAGLSLAALACGGPRRVPRQPVPLVPSVAIVGATLWDGTGRGRIPVGLDICHGAFLSAGRGRTG